ncbi:hypothetical protein ABPG72_002165 [Tetrahymena utriculariae]
MKKYKSFIWFQILIFTNFILYAKAEVCKDIAKYSVNQFSQGQTKEIALSTVEQIVHDQLKQSGKLGWTTYIPSWSTIGKMVLRFAIVRAATAFTSPAGGAIAVTLVDTLFIGADAASGNFVGAGIGIVFIPLNFIGLGSTAKNVAQKAANTNKLNKRTCKQFIQEIQIQNWQKIYQKKQLKNIQRISQNRLPSMKHKNSSNYKQKRQVSYLNRVSKQKNRITSVISLLLQDEANLNLFGKKRIK